MKNTYYMTWTEYRNNFSRDYIAVIFGDSVKQVKETVYFPEQNERRLLGKPHMFHTKISKNRPEDAASRMPGHLYF